MTKLFGAQKFVLQAIQDSPEKVTGFVTDVQIARDTSIVLPDVRNWFETLEGEGHVEVARTMEGFRASITARGRLALTQFQSFQTSEASIARSENTSVTDSLLAKLEEFLTDDRHRIALSRLIQDTTEAAYKASLKLHELGLRLAPTVESCAEWLSQYDSMMESLLALVTYGCRWGEPRHLDLWVRCIDRMAGILGEDLGFAPGIDLRSYPATLLLFGGGIASVAAGRYDSLYALFEKTSVRRWGEPSLPAALILHGTARLMFPQGSYSLDDFMSRLMNPEVRYTPTSDHIHEVLREPMRGIEPDNYKYELLFDRLECLLALTVGHLQAGPVKRLPHIAEARPSLPLLGIPMPVGRFGWRRNNHPDMLGSLRTEQTSLGTIWPPLAAGMFGGDVQRFQGLVGSLESRVREKDWR